MSQTTTYLRPEPGSVQHAQDRRLRRALLNAARVWADSATTNGWAPGYALRDTAIDPDSGFAELVGQNARALALLRDLCRKGLLEEKRSDLTLRRGDTITLGHVSYTLTSAGARLLDLHDPPDPDIEDDRVVPHA